MPPACIRIVVPGFRRGFHRARGRRRHAYASGYVSPRGVRTWGEGCRCSLSSVSSRRSREAIGNTAMCCCFTARCRRDTREDEGDTRGVAHPVSPRLQQIGARPGKAAKQKGAKSEESVA